jgi:hypothetical protein
MTKMAESGSESGSISQRHGSADPDPDPDPPQNVMDPQHCFLSRVHLSTSFEDFFLLSAVNSRYYLLIFGLIEITIFFYIFFSVADPGSGSFFYPESGIGFFRIPTHISETLVGVKSAIILCQLAQTFVCTCCSWIRDPKSGWIKIRSLIFRF